MIRLFKRLFTPRPQVVIVVLNIGERRVSLQRKQDNFSAWQDANGWRNTTREVLREVGARGSIREMFNGRERIRAVINGRL